MFCCPHCSRLSTILFNIVTTDCRLVQAQQLVQYLLATLNNVGNKTLFNAVFIRPEQVVYIFSCVKAAFKAWSADILQTDLLSTSRYQDVFVLLATGC